MKDLLKTMLAASVLCLAGCADDPDVAPIKRDTDAVEVAYSTGATAQFTVRFNGPWEARVVCQNDAGTDIDSWFAITPESGVGNGKEYQYITVTAQRNADKARTGYVYLAPKESAAEPLKITVRQADGIFSVKKPSIAGTIKSGSPSTGELLVEYDKAFGGEKIEIMAALSGDGSDGLEIRDSYETTIPEEGSGTVSIPITGTPSFLGKLTFSVTVLLDGESIFSGDVDGNVISNNEVFREGFDKFVWGGKYIENKKGPGPNGTAGAGKDFMGTEEAEEDMIGIGSDGTSDVFLTMTEQYRKNRGVEKWDGSKIYEHPGYLKMGTGSASGWIMTPELEGLSSAPETVVLSIDFCRFDNEGGTYYVTAEGAGVVTNGTVNTTILPPPANASERRWTTLTFTIEGATNKTRIKLAAEDFSAGNKRLNIDNFVVMGAAKADVKEQLPAPDAGKIVSIPSQTSIRYTWEGVKGATGYEASLAQQSKPDFRKSLKTEGTDVTFEELAPGYYLFTVKALYADNSEFDSDETTVLSGTLGYPVEKLAAPTDLAYTATTSSVKLTWSFVPGAVYYVVDLKAMDGSAVGRKQVTEATCEFGELTPGTDYKASVQAFVAEGNEYNSDVAQIDVATINPVPLTAPAVALYAKTHGWAVIEWELSDEALAEQPLAGGKVDTYDFRLKDAAGNVVNGYVQENFAKFAFDRYKFLRFVFGGLKPATSYTIEMRRKSTADKNLYADSEWVAVPFTTDAAPSTSDYLFYADFENYPYGAQPIMCAYGSSIGSGITDYAAQVKLGGASSANYVYNPNGKWDNATFCAAYAPMWSMAELNDASLCSNVALATGVMKLGGGSKPAWVTLPKLTSLGAATDIVLELDASPYIEPSKTAATNGSMEQDLAANEGLEFYVQVSGATIAEVDGATLHATEASLKNVASPEMGGVGAEALKRFVMTGHRVKIEGATAQTRIKIYTALENDGKQHRIWLDNLRVRKAN